MLEEENERLRAEIEEQRREKDEAVGEKIRVLKEFHKEVESLRARLEEAEAARDEARTEKARRSGGIRNQLDDVQTSLQARINEAEGDADGDGLSETLQLRERVRELEEERDGLKRELAEANRRVAELEAAGAARTRRTATLGGSPILGSKLEVEFASGERPSDVQFQWFRVQSDGSEVAIPGARRHQYAPEPADAGCHLICSITSASMAERESLTTDSCVDFDAELINHVRSSSEAFRRGASFKVLLVHLNGVPCGRKEVYSLDVEPSGVALRKSASSEILHSCSYRPELEACGARGGGAAAQQGLYIGMAGTGVMLACTSSLQRNTALILMRRFAEQQGLHLRGPQEPSPSP